MGRPTQIPKEKILDASLKLLIREGHDAIKMSAIAKELHCSTQPISWAFGNMQNFRRELKKYAQNYVDEKLRPKAKKPLAGFASIGRAYIDMAREEPNLLRYLFADTSYLRDDGGMGEIFLGETHDSMVTQIADCLHATKEQIERMVLTLVIFTHGIVMILLGNPKAFTKEETDKMLANIGVSLLMSFGYQREEAIAFYIDEEEEH